MDTKFDLSSLRKAIDSLARGVKRSASNPDDEELRDAVIHRFEYTYELCWRMIKRRIEMESAVPADVDGMSFRQLMREAGAYRGRPPLVCLSAAAEHHFTCLRRRKGRKGLFNRTGIPSRCGNRARSA